jgi:prepilin-type N-terminal cleavage/methylation domain-containing protein
MNKGFTLIETLIYIALIGVVLSGFIVFSFSIGDARNKTYVVQEVQANARVALNLITQKILAANGVNAGSSTFGSDPGVLSLSMSEAGNNPTVISLNANDGQLQIKEGSADAVVITSDEVKVMNLVFTNLSGTNEKENIKVELTIDFNNQGTDIDFDYTQSWETALNIRQ